MMWRVLPCLAGSGRKKKKKQFWDGDTRDANIINQEPLDQSYIIYRIITQPNYNHRNKQLTNIIEIMENE